MSNLTLRIGGRDYSVACAEGEEAHVTHLGQMIDTKLASLEGSAGHSETRGLLFAALLLADELHDTRSRAHEALRTVDDARTKESAALARQADNLERLAARMENLAQRLEHRLPNA